MNTNAASIHQCSAIKALMTAWAALTLGSFQLMASLDPRTQEATSSFTDITSHEHCNFKPFFHLNLRDRNDIYLIINRHQTQWKSDRFLFISKVKLSQSRAPASQIIAADP